MQEGQFHCHAFPEEKKTQILVEQAFQLAPEICSLSPESPPRCVSPCPGEQSSLSYLAPSSLFVTFSTWHNKVY